MIGCRRVRSEYAFPFSWRIDDPQRRIYVGSAPASERMTGAEEHGVLVKDAEGTKSVMGWPEVGFA
jgi:hypothetical protein